MQSVAVIDSIMNKVFLGVWCTMHGNGRGRKIKGMAAATNNGASR